MTTFTNFQPSGTTSPPFQFSATLNGQQFNVTATWNVFGSRWYINVFSLDGTLIGSRALVGSPTGQALAALAWAGGKAIVTTTGPHGIKVGQIASLTVSGASPDAYSGLWQCFSTGPNTLTYGLATDPGMATVFGTLSFNVNLVGGLSDPTGAPFTSTLVYRVPANRFEVAP